MENNPINPKLQDLIFNLSLKEQQILQKQLSTPDTGVVEKFDHKFSNRKRRIGVMSDTHIGSKYFNERLFDKLLKQFERSKVEGVYHSGDILEGMSGRPGHIYELDSVGLSAQLDKAEMLFSKTKLPIYGIIGNHDRWFLEKADIGANVGRLLEGKLNNFTFLGIDEANVDMFDGVTMKLIHPGKGTSYALSYQGQKLIESFSDKEKPQIVLSGHYHKALYMNVRDVHHFECGTVCEQTGWMRSKNLAAHTGGWLIDIYKDGRIKSEFIK